LSSNDGNVPVELRSVQWTGSVARTASMLHVPIHLSPVIVRAGLHQTRFVCSSTSRVAFARRRGAVPAAAMPNTAGRPTTQGRSTEKYGNKLPADVDINRQTDRQTDIHFIYHDKKTIIATLKQYSGRLPERILRQSWSPGVRTAAQLADHPRAGTVIDREIRQLVARRSRYHTNTSC